MYYLYIIYSDSIDRYYVGTSRDVANRLDRHNAHYFRKGFTKAARDWRTVLSFPCETREDALYLERFVKRMKSRKFIMKIITDTAILDDILEKR